MNAHSIPADRKVDISATDAVTAFKVLSKSIGPQAEIWVSLKTVHGQGPIAATVYPRGIGFGSPEYEVFAETFSELLEKTDAAWTARQDERRIKTIRAMALAVIRLTDELGACTDAALRAEFARQDVETYGADACTKADEMAGRGPFRIAAAARANAPDDLGATDASLVDQAHRRGAEIMAMEGGRG